MTRWVIILINIVTHPSIIFECEGDHVRVRKLKSRQFQSAHPAHLSTVVKDLNDPH